MFPKHLSGGLRQKDRWSVDRWQKNLSPTHILSSLIWRLRGKLLKLNCLEKRLLLWGLALAGHRLCWGPWPSYLGTVSSLPDSLTILTLTVQLSCDSPYSLVRKHQKRDRSLAQMLPVSNPYWESRASAPLSFSQQLSLTALSVYMGNLPWFYHLPFFYYTWREKV